ncbi:hypothetical protein TWF281_008671 [Arthrobotrys megalospora]
MEDFTQAPVPNLDLQTEGDALRAALEDLVDRASGTELFVSKNWLVTDIRRIHSRCLKSEGHHRCKEERMRCWWERCYEELEETEESIGRLRQRIKEKLCAIQCTSVEAKQKLQEIRPLIFEV